MKKMWLVVVIVVLLSYTSFAGIIRMFGSNSNTIINSIEILPYDPPQFATNFTIRANITDDDDRVIWVNFTLWNPSQSIQVINMSNGTNNGSQDFWNSTHYVINESGTWIYNVSSSDNNTVNSTVNFRYINFTITDNVEVNKQEIKIPMNTSENKSFIIGVISDTKEYLNFTLEYNMTNTNFTLSLNTSHIMVNSSEYVNFNFTIGTNVSVTAGTHYGNVTIKRKYPFEWNLTIDIAIEETNEFGDIELVDAVDQHFVVCPGTQYISFNTTNIGNYRLTNCHPYFWGRVGGVEGEYGSSDNESFELGAGESGTITMEYYYNAQADLKLTFDINCTATASGGSDSLSGVKPTQVSFDLAPGCSSGASPGGGGVTQITPPRAKIEVPEAKKMPVAVCGNGVCEEGESLWSCREDCMKNLFELDKIFCLPLFKCGNWSIAWFANSVIILLVSGFITFMILARKAGRLR